MPPFNWTDLIHNSALFGRLTDAEIAELISVSEEESHDNGAIILKEGESGGHVFIIGKGTVSITLAGVLDHRLPIDSIGAGNFFGEMAWLENKPRLATVVADSDCLLLKVPFGEFHQLMDKNARFASKVSLILSERLRKLTEEILAVRLKNVDERLELSNTKLDASLKAMDSQMKAAETMFDQTSTRAGDVIQSFERTRNQIVSVGKVAVLIATAIVGLLGWFGFNKFDSITNTFNESVKEFDENVENQTKEVNNSALKFDILFKNLFKKIENQTNDFDAIRQASATQLSKQSEKMVEASEQMEKVNEQLKIITKNKNAVDAIRFASGLKFAEENRLSKTLISLYTLLVKYNFSIIVQEGRTDLYKEILAVEDQNITEEVFKQFINSLIAANGQQQDQYTKMIRIGLNRGYTLTDRQKALSYYCLIAASLLVDDEQEYITTRKDFDEFIQGIHEPINFIQNLGPNWFIEHIASLPEDKRASFKIERVKDVWQRMTST